MMFFSHILKLNELDKKNKCWPKTLAEINIIITLLDTVLNETSRQGKVV